MENGYKPWFFAVAGLLQTVVLGLSVWTLTTVLALREGFLELKAEVRANSRAIEEHKKEPLHQGAISEERFTRFEVWLKEELKRLGR